MLTKLCVTAIRCDFLLLAPSNSQLHTTKALPTQRIYISNLGLTVVVSMWLITDTLRITLIVERDRAAEETRVTRLGWRLSPKCHYCQILMLAGTLRPSSSTLYTRLPSEHQAILLLTLLPNSQGAKIQCVLTNHAWDVETANVSPSFSGGTLDAIGMYFFLFYCKLLTST
jgi:hypothetical protein